MVTSRFPRTTMATTRATTLEGGLSGARLRSATGCTSEVYRHGAHVASWRDAEGEDIIFLSSRAVFKPPKAIRGGIPLCFPQFSDLGPLAQQHGFARNEQWQHVDPPDVRDEDGANVTMRLVASDATRAVWPHEFVATFAVRLVGDEMHTSLTVRNTDATPFEFTVALHTYFAVGDIARASVIGLENARYLDSLDGRVEKTDSDKAVVFEREVDRIYRNTPDVLTVVDAGNDRSIVITKTNLPDAIVWNPWVEKSLNTSDLGDLDYKSFLCVEAAATATPVALEPGAEWTCGQVLRVVKKTK